MTGIWVGYKRNESVRMRMTKQESEVNLRRVPMPNVGMQWRRCDEGFWSLHVQAPPYILSASAVFLRFVEAVTAVE